MAWLELRGDTFRINFWHDGRHYRRSLKTGDERKAAVTKLWVEENLSDLERGRLRLPADADLIAFLMSDGEPIHRPQVAPPIAALTLGASSCSNDQAGGPKESAMSPFPFAPFPFASRALPVQRQCDQLLSDAGFAADQDRGAVARRTGDLVAEFHHRAAVAEDRFRRPRLSDQAGILRLQAAARAKGVQEAGQRSRDHFAVALIPFRECAVCSVKVDRTNEAAARPDGAGGRDRDAQRVAKASQALGQGSGRGLCRLDTAAALQNLLRQLPAQRYIQGSLLRMDHSGLRLFVQAEIAGDACLGLAGEAFQGEPDQSRVVRGVDRPAQEGTQGS